MCTVQQVQSPQCFEMSAKISIFHTDLSVSHMKLHAIMVAIVFHKNICSTSSHIILKNVISKKCVYLRYMVRLNRLPLPTASGNQVRKFLGDML